MGRLITLSINVRGLRRSLREITEAIMAAKEDVRTALDRLTAAVDRLAAGGVGTGGLTEEEAAAAAGEITTQAQRLEAIPTANGGTPTPAAAAPLRK